MYVTAVTLVHIQSDNIVTQKMKTAFTKDQLATSPTWHSTAAVWIKLVYHMYQIITEQGITRTSLSGTQISIERVN